MGKLSICIAVSLVVTVGATTSALAGSMKIGGSKANLAGDHNSDKFDRLTGKQLQTNSDNEMKMMQLQKLTQQRSQMIQAGSNLLSSIDEAQSNIIGNLR